MVPCAEQTCVPTITALQWPQKCTQKLEKPGHHQHRGLLRTCWALRRRACSAKDWGSPPGAAVSGPCPKPRAGFSGWASAFASPAGSSGSR